MRIESIFSKKNAISTAEENFSDTQNPNFIVDRDEIIKLLSNFQEQQIICNINPIQSKIKVAKVTCQLLEIQEENNLLFISPFDINQNNQANNKISAFKVSALFNNVSLAFILSGMKPDNSQNIQYFQAPIPKKIYYPQRREAIRICTRHENISFMASEADFKAEVFDLSSSGVAVLSSSLQRVLNKGDLLESCQINLPTGDIINFDLIVCFAAFRDKAADNFKLGGFFKNMSSRHQKKLDHYIATLERTAIRNQKN